MAKAMYQNLGIGLAVQVGYELRIFIMDCTRYQNNYKYLLILKLLKQVMKC